MSERVGWEPLQARFGQDLSGLPVVLCGPILRKVTRTEVSVFLVLSEPATLTLKVVDDDNPDDGVQFVFLEGCRDTVALGDKVHVALVTAQPTLDQPLLEGRLWYYDVEIATSSGTLSLAANDYRVHGVLSQGSSLSQLYDGQALTHLLTYDNAALPSFVVPTSDLDQVRVLHGSCRKPHGGGRDALPVADDILINDASSPSRRPQQLFLTGDQVYCDDVADLLLLMIQDAQQLFGWTEDQPAGLPQDYRPNHRFHLAELGMLSHREIPFGSTYGADSVAYHRSRLVLFQEYALMYIFAWSPVLWPETLPTASDLPPYPSVHNIPGGSAGAVLNVERATAGHREDLERFRRGLLQVRRALANIPTYMMFDDHEITDDLFLNLRWCQLMKEAISQLGRYTLGAGFAAYAIFQGWGNDPDQFSSASAGGALLQFFDRRPMSASAAAANYPEETWEDIHKKVLPDLQLHSDNDNNNKVEYTWVLTHLPGAIDWHWCWSDPAVPYQVLSLDTRTWRSFAGADKQDDDWFVGLISRDGMDRMFGMLDPSLPLTFLLSPAPVVGMRWVEWNVQEEAEDFANRLKSDCEAWSLDPGAFERLLARMHEALGDGNRKVITLSGDVHYGFTQRMQYWATRPFETATSAAESSTVMAQLTSSSLKNLTYGGVLSNIRADGRGMTIQAHILGYEPVRSALGVKRLPPVGKTLGWNDDGARPAAVRVRAEERPRGSDPDASGNMLDTPQVAWRRRIVRLNRPPTDAKLRRLEWHRPAFKRYGRWTLPATRPPDWQYRVDFCVAMGPEQWQEAAGQALGQAIRGVVDGELFPAQVPTLTGADLLALSSYGGHSRNFLHYVQKFGHGKELVGECNLGDVRVSWSLNDDERFVVHDLWWRLRGAGNVELDEAHPLSRFVVPLGETYTPFGETQVRYPRPTDSLDEPRANLGEAR